MIDFRHVVAALLVIALAVLTGCGPVTYIGEVRRASDAVDAARAADAERLSPYWWTRATQYLHKARELAGHADYQAANRYGRLSAEAANAAEQEAVAAAEAPAKTDEPAKAEKGAKPANVPSAPAKDSEKPAKDDEKSTKEPKAPKNAPVKDAP